MIKMSLKILIPCLLTALVCIAQTGGDKSNKNMPYTTDESVIPREKQISYQLVVHAGTGYELFIDDVLCGFSLNEGTENSGALLNAYLLENGKHQLKIKVYPEEKARKMSGEVVLEKVFLKEDKKVTLRSYPFVLKDKKTDKEFSWEIDIDDLPYHLKGWSEGPDLRSEDQLALRKEVVDFYNHARLLYQDGGNADALVALTKKAKMEKRVYDYKIKAVEDYADQLEKEAYNRKTRMEPVEDYKMVIYGKGKLVALERNPVKTIAGYPKEGNFTHWSALIGHFEDGNGIYQIPMLLYRPKAGAALERIR